MQQPPGRGAGTGDLVASLSGDTQLIPQGWPHPQDRAGPRLRDYQTNVIADIDAAVAAGTRRILLVAPTGSGKTVIAAAVMERAFRQRKRVLFLVHRRELVFQTCRKLHDVGYDHGVLLPGYPTRLHVSLQVASIATLHARAVRTAQIELPEADLVVVDEAHHARARTYQKLLELYPHAVVIGLTATPARASVWATLLT